ncbi:hypothetical protein [Acinetobacter phage AbKT21phiIII]|uniref:Uncharacterized protein n=1 Tax=Acinetobacter phage AbKT21phiIII TaxID=2500826 RepID=A0A3T0IGH9_9CAUD|nr:hypothetical protein HOU98_gp07 [Acinetobacter phage AbKT21phiIII]AZU98522.1 hypothetical protein [Acinetobacter phage AbKT21phiIII]
MNIVKGEYLTRNGTRVTVHDVKEGSSFTVKGSIWKMFRGKYVPRTFNVWMPDGRLLPNTESPLDIVSVYQS